MWSKVVALWICLSVATGLFGVLEVRAQEPVESDNIISSQEVSKDDQPIQFFIKSEESLDTVSDVSNDLETYAPLESDSTSVVSQWRDGYVVTFENREDAEEALEDLDEQIDVSFSQEVYEYSIQSYTPDDPLFSQMWQYQDAPSGNNTQSAWTELSQRYGVTCGQNLDRDCGGDINIRIGIVDTGINPAVSDLSGVSLDEASSAQYYNPSSNVCPGDEFFYADTRTQRNICKKEGSQFDDNNHGTMVASLIAAQDNSTGFVGISPNVSLVSAAIHGTSTFNTITVSDAVYHLADAGVDVINMSIGGTGSFDTVLEQAINYATDRGVVVVAASGNQALAGNPTVYPAAFANTIAVGASNFGPTLETVTRSEYSTFGSYIDVVAPVGDTNGQEGYRGILTQDKDGIIAFSEGTSWAAPQVSSAVALLKSFREDFTVNDIRTLLSETSKDIGSQGKDDQFGYGLLDVHGLLEASPLLWQFQNGQTDNVNAIAEFNGKSFQLHRSVGGTDMYQKVSADGGQTWGQWQRLPGSTSVDPVMYVIDDRIWQIHQSALGEIYSRYSLDGDVWTNWERQPGQSFYPISMTYFDDTLYQVHRGLTNGLMFLRYSFNQGQTWTGWILLDGQTPTIPVLAASEDRLWMAHTGTDQRIYTRYTEDGTQWTDWEQQNGWSASNLHMYNDQENVYLAHTGSDGFNYYVKPLLPGQVNNAWTYVQTNVRVGQSYGYVKNDGSHVLSMVEQVTKNIYIREDALSD